MPEYDYPLTITFDNGSYTHRPEFAERIPHGRSEYVKYNSEKPEKWFGKFNRFARIILVAQEEVSIAPEDAIVFEDPLHPYDHYRIGIKTGDMDDCQNLFEALKAILEQKPINTTYTKSEFPRRPRYIRRRGFVYGVFEVKAYRDY